MKTYNRQMLCMKNMKVYSQLIDEQINTSRKVST
jgi:hypothetical protein